MKCKICKDNIKRNFFGISQHVNRKHNIKIFQYFQEFENFQIPKCKYCSSNAKHRTGLKFRLTCNSNKCKKLFYKERICSDQTRDKIRKARLKYMKNNPDQTSWRLGGKMSYPEKLFSEALYKYGYFNKFEIIREKSFFPYYADFAFENVKIVIEIDGSQHNLIERKKQDILKDQLIVQNGWRVIRFSASQIMQNINSVLNELDIFIGKIDNLAYTSNIITESEKRKIIKIENKKRKILLKQDNLNKLIEIIKNSNINFSKKGWSQLVSNIIKIKSNKVTYWMRKNMYEFWINNCKIRKNTIIAREG